MIPPKEKAMELMLKYYNAIPMNTVSFAKQFALIAVDELIKQVNYLHVEYWKEVKQYIIEIQ
jgi:hypothetical protein